jgi:CheY-like chemotaxis protein
VSQLILLVDADSDSRNILKVYLEHHGYRVVVSANGAEGLEAVREEGPDLIIGDFPLDVPGHSPFTDAARDDLAYAGPVLSITARARPEDIEAARAKSSAVLLKPVHPSRVLEEVERLLSDA